MSDRERLRQALLDPTPRSPGILYDLALKAFNQASDEMHRQEQRA